MIITKNGKAKTKVQWWVNIKITCISCTCEFKLETKDILDPLIQPQDDNIIRVACPVCANIVELNNNG